MTVGDANSVTDQRQFTVAIGAGVTFSTPASLPNGTAGSAYNFQLQASGGQAPYSWSITEGSLPDGLSLNGVSGVISGVPAAAGTFNFTVRVADSGSMTATRVHAVVIGVPSLLALSINGLTSNLQPLQQPLIDLSLASAYPVPITGTVSLAFSPGGANPMDDPSVQFSTGGRSAAFTIPANATHATFGAPQFAIQTGSVTGTITLSVVLLQAAGTSFDIPSGLTLTTTVPPGPPVIRSLSLVRNQNGFDLQLVGLSATRELSNATVTFQPAPGATLATPQVTLPLSDAAKAWFQNSGSGAFGGQFGLTLPFTFQGDVSLTSVSVVLSNGAGGSQAASANY